MKENITNNIKNLQSPQDIQIKFEFTFIKLQEEIINTNLLHPIADSDPKNQGFALPPPAIQDDNLLNTISVVEIRERIENAKDNYKALKVFSLHI